MIISLGIFADYLIKIAILPILAVIGLVGPLFVPPLYPPTGPQPEPPPAPTPGNDPTNPTTNPNNPSDPQSPPTPTPQSGGPTTENGPTDDPYNPPKPGEDPEPAPTPDDDECDPAVDEECEEDQVIYREGRDRAKTVQLSRELDWRTGMSFSTVMPSVEHIKYRVKDLISHGYIVKFDGGQRLTEIFTGNPVNWPDGSPRYLGPNHVSVYLPVQAIWDAWYQAEQLNKDTPNVSGYTTALYQLRLQ